MNSKPENHDSSQDLSPDVDFDIDQVMKEVREADEASGAEGLDDPLDGITMEALQKVRGGMEQMAFDIEEIDIPVPDEDDEEDDQDSGSDSDTWISDRAATTAKQAKQASAPVVEDDEGVEDADVQPAAPDFADEPDLPAGPADETKTLQARLFTLAVGMRLYTAAEAIQGQRNLQADIRQLYTDARRVASDILEGVGVENDDLQEHPWLWTEAVRLAVDMMERASGFKGDDQDGESDVTLSSLRSYCDEILRCMPDADDMMADHAMTTVVLPDVTRFRLRLMTAVSRIYAVAMQRTFMQPREDLLALIPQQLLALSFDLGDRILPKGADVPQVLEITGQMMDILSELVIVNWKLAFNDMRNDIQTGSRAAGLSAESFFVEHGGKTSYGQSWLNKMWGTTANEAGRIIGLVSRLVVEA